MCAGAPNNIFFIFIFVCAIPLFHVQCLAPNNIIHVYLCGVWPHYSISVPSVHYFICRRHHYVSGRRPTDDGARACCPAPDVAGRRLRCHTCIHRLKHAHKAQARSHSSVYPLTIYGSTFLSRPSPWLNLRGEVGRD